MTSYDEQRRQRAGARVAGLMYLFVLVVDLTGMQMGSTTGRVLLLTGALATVPLAIGLRDAVRSAGAAAATVAMVLRLAEAGLGIAATLRGFPRVHEALIGSPLGNGVLAFLDWNSAASFAATIFTMGSTIFFALFWRGRLIPRVLAGLGLLASVMALSACTMHLVRPTFSAMTMWAWAPMLLAEISTGLWLLIRAGDVGGRDQRSTG